uniref:Putative ovule protein n=1 Tax=Solanum chacoense TaxID=4108 RepID=A0A0V0GU73_SOLCH
MEGFFQMLKSLSLVRFINFSSFAWRFQSSHALYWITVSPVILKLILVINKLTHTWLEDIRKKGCVSFR